MVRKVCLDSDMLLALLNKDEQAKTIISSIDGQFVSTSINSFEVWYGRKAQEPVSELFDWLDIFQFDGESARIAADIMRSLKLKGKMIEMRDIFIASICIKNNMELLTRNKKHFSRLKEFGLRMID